MSLLLDAIKKAEHRERGGETESREPPASSINDNDDLATSDTGDLDLAIDLDLLDDPINPVESPADDTLEPGTETATPELTIDTADTALTLAIEEPENVLEKDPSADTAVADTPLVEKPEPVDALDPPATSESVVLEPPAPTPDPVPAPEQVVPVPAPLPQNEESPASREPARKFSPVLFLVLLTLGLGGVGVYYYLASLGDTPPTSHADHTTAFSNFHRQSESGIGASESDPQASAKTIGKAATDAASAEPDQPEQLTTEPSAPSSNSSSRPDLTNPDNRLDPGPDPVNTAAFQTVIPAESIVIKRSVAANHETLKQQALAAFNSGDLQAAEQQYRRWKNLQPQSVAARFGLARVALARADVTSARAYYLDILQLEPDNTAAQASLLNLPGLENQENLRRLQALLDAHPRNSYLNYVMGNYQAGIGRWQQAQQLYFNALSGQNDNAVYAFNLAIALDQLGQSAAAADHYRRSLRLTTEPLPATARQQAEQRLIQLTPTTQPINPQ
ncbi:MAG: hypothetical protein P1U54_01855 [Immundisolibacteraceae bacterium]|nr:hypothetical protein [Immundisolibacteraceae bacterium]